MNKYHRRECVAYNATPNFPAGNASMSQMTCILQLNVHESLHYLGIVFRRKGDGFMFFYYYDFRDRGVIERVKLKEFCVILSSLGRPSLQASLDLHFMSVTRRRLTHNCTHI